jgi:hypothetical protein
MKYRLCVRRSLVALFATSLVALPAAVAEPPDLELNPATGNVESVDIDLASGSRVRHVFDRGQGGLGTNMTVSAPLANNPRIAITPEGDTWVVWWKSGVAAEVWLRVRDLGTGTWGTETRVSDPAAASRYPEIVHSGGVAWIAFEVEGGAGWTITLAGISDSPEPIDLLAVASTSYAGDRDVLAHTAAGHLWVTWVESDTHVGWSEYDEASESWGEPGYESYAGTTVEHARSAIEAAVVGP